MAKNVFQKILQDLVTNGHMRMERSWETDVGLRGRQRLGGFGPWASCLSWSVRHSAASAKVATHQQAAPLCSAGIGP